MGALSGIRIVEMAGLGPAPFCGMMLADHGAEVIRVERPGDVPTGPGDPRRDPLLRSRKTVAIDLKSADGVEAVRSLARSADGLIEGFRPGVMERLGLGPDHLLLDNPRLVYGRMTGWGQTGPYSDVAGHDINYIALAGALHAFGRSGEKPTPPANLVGDFGGGGMLLAFGMLAGLLSARSTGRGQVVDCAMTEGAALLMGLLQGLANQGFWRDERGVNLLDTGAHFYEVYECADGKYLSVGAIEPQFYEALLAGLGFADRDALGAQMDPSTWPQAKAQLSALFLTRSRDDWCAVFNGVDACVAPVLSMTEAPRHPHNIARDTFTVVDGDIQPAPAPRFSATPAGIPTPKTPFDQPMRFSGSETTARRSNSPVESHAVSPGKSRR